MTFSSAQDDWQHGSLIRNIRLAGAPVTVDFVSSFCCVYTLWFNIDLDDALFADLAGQPDVPGIGGVQALTDTNALAPWCELY